MNIITNRVIDLFVRVIQQPLPILPPVPPELRKPLRVLGLFDGISTGYVVLKELGLEVECYVSSEVDMSAVNVSCAHHPDIIHVGDVCSITEKEVGVRCLSTSFVGKGEKSASMRIQTTPNW